MLLLFCYFIKYFLSCVCNDLIFFSVEGYLRLIQLGIVKVMKSWQLTIVSGMECLLYFVVDTGSLNVNGLFIVQCYSTVQSRVV